MFRLTYAMLHVHDELPEVPETLPCAPFDPFAMKDSW